MSGCRPFPVSPRTRSRPIASTLRICRWVTSPACRFPMSPGSGVWAGVIVMGIGLAFVFYVVHVRFWTLPVHDARGRLVLWVGGTANKSREVFEERFAKLVEEIESELKKEPKACPSARATHWPETESRNGEYI